LPVVTWLLIATNVLVFVYQEFVLLPAQARVLALAGGAIPYEIVNWVDIRPRDLLPLPGSIFTSMFLHGGWMHLIGNMWFLWIFGDNVEDHLGAIRYVLFYFIVGGVGALAQAFSAPSSTVPMIGASGAIAGVLGGYVMLFPRAQVRTFVGIPFLWHIRDVPAWFFLGVWFLGQFLIPSNSGVAWMAHVGGFLAGLGAVRLLARTRPHSPTAPPDVEYLPPPRRGPRW
jgi:membrane associated rhomboid family serine protease